MTEGAYRRIFPESGEKDIAACMEYYGKNMVIFSRVCKNIYSTDPDKRRNDLIGFARYLVSRIFVEDEEQGVDAIQRIGVLLISASDSFMKLIGNSAQDTIGMDGRPAFTVARD
jgi:hypothetical protein